MSDSTRPPSEKTNSIAVFCLFLGVAATLATGQLFGYLGFLPELFNRFGQGASLGLPLFALGYAIGMVSIGSLAERFGARNIMVFSLLLGGLSSIISAYSITLPMLLSLRLVEGVLLGGFPPAAFVAANQKVSRQKILFANSAMAFGLLGSAGIAGLFTRLFNSISNWQFGLSIYGCLLLLAAFGAFVQKGINPGDESIIFPYKNFHRELLNFELIRSAFLGSSTMAVFVFVNSAAQRGSHPIAALVIVAAIVLAVLSFSKTFVKYGINARRLFGLILIFLGIVVLTVQSNLILFSLALICMGATITIPASIQSVVVSSRKSVPSAVSLFTCSLFIGGALVGLSVTGIIRLSPQFVLIVLDVIICAAVFVVLARYLMEVSKRSGNEKE